MLLQNQDQNIKSHMCIINTSKKLTQHKHHLVKTNIKAKWPLENVSLIFKMTTGNGWVMVAIRTRISIIMQCGCKA